jgi:hypothetical protein
MEREILKKTETGAQQSVKHDDWRTVFDGVVKPY